MADFFNLPAVLLSTYFGKQVNGTHLQEYTNMNLLQGRWLKALSGFYKSPFHGFSRGCRTQTLQQRGINKAY